MYNEVSKIFHGIAIRKETFKTRKTHPVKFDPANEKNMKEVTGVHTKLFFVQK